MKINDETLDVLVKEYQSGKTIKELKVIFGIHEQTIVKYLKQRGVFSPKTHNWTDRDSKKLLEVYPSGDWDLICKTFPNRTKQFLYEQASKLNIRRDNYFWTEHDKNILIEFYNNIGAKGVKPMLDGNYSIKLIQNQAKKMGLTKSRFWTNDEISVLTENYPTVGTAGMFELLPNRSKAAIIHETMLLGLRCECFWSEGEKQFVKDNWENMSDQELAQALGRGVKGVADQRRKLGLYYTVPYNGYYTLINYIRMNITEWKKKSMEASGYKCVLTGGNFDDIHHQYSFNSILEETLKVTNMDDRESIDDYTDEELKFVLDTFKSIQDTYPLGVCLSKEVHKLFHKIYGYGNNTPEQWEEFKLNYNNNVYK